MILALDHVGIAVRSIDESLRFWELALGLELAGRENVATEGVDVAFLPAGRSRLELLQATRADSPVARFLDKRGPGIHHLTFEVDDLVATLDRLAGVGIELLDRIPRTGAGGSRVAFVHPRATGGVLVELVERARRAHARGGLEVGETVLAYLRDPHEKLWGVLRRLDPSGVVIEGIDLTSFDDWVAQVESGEDTVVGPSVVFLPTPRIERVLLDRPSGSLPSLADRFLERTGRTVQQVLAG
jgi:methylmalonyl-CoA epimerase